MKHAVLITNDLFAIRVTSKRSIVPQHKHVYDSKTYGKILKQRTGKQLEKKRSQTLTAILTTPANSLLVQAVPGCLDFRCFQWRPSDPVKHIKTVKTPAKHIAAVKLCKAYCVSTTSECQSNTDFYLSVQNVTHMLRKSLSIVYPCYTR